MAKFQDDKLNDWYKPHAAVVSDDFDPSLTRQEFAEECDVNAIMKRFEKGESPSFNPRVPMYVDLTDMPDNLQDTLNMLKAAEDSFMSLPALVRKEFDNDPVNFVEFAADPTNVDQMRAWGLAKPAEVPPAPQRVEIVNPPPAPVEPPRPV